MSRIVPAVALLVLAAAGCGGADRSQRAAVPGIPRALAQGWERQATAVANAAATGNSCGALRLAVALRNDVVSSRHRVPLPLRSPLLTGVKTLAERVTCDPVVQKPPQKPPPKQHPKPPKHPKPKPPHHGHDDKKGHK